MTKQVFELISDATVLSDIHSLGAVIIRTKGTTESEFITSYKLLFIFPACDSSHAELMAGLHGISHLISYGKSEHMGFSNSTWIMDLPHIEAIIRKQRQADQVPTSFKEILDLIPQHSLKIRLPKGKNELYKHHLCHRMCTLGRKFFEGDNQLNRFFINFSSHLKKINSDWTLIEQNIKEN